nr:MAG TPA: hypothetical protein [Caudoviricetes sp.]
MKIEVLQLWNRIDMMRALESEMRRCLLGRSSLVQAVNLRFLDTIYLKG